MLLIGSLLVQYTYISLVSFILTLYFFFDCKLVLYDAIFIIKKSSSQCRVEDHHYQVICVIIITRSIFPSDLFIQPGNNKPIISEDLPDAML